MENKDHYSIFAEEWTQRMRDGKNIVHDYIAKPALYSNLGDVKDKDVLCIGCGSGEECAHIASLGAKRVVGIDLSPAFIEIARKSFPDIEFYVMDMEDLSFVRESFDVVVSSLTIHYVPSWAKSLEEIKRVLRVGGRAVITSNHPIRFGSQMKRVYKCETFVMGYTRYKDLKTKEEVYGDYLNEREIEDKWFNKFNVTYYHKSISGMFKAIKDSGLSLVNFLEPKPEPWVKDANESFYNIHTKIPFIVLFEVVK